MVVVVQQDGRPIDRPVGFARPGGPGAGGGTIQSVTDGAAPVRVLRADGELDLAAVPDLLARVPDLVDGAAGVVLDLRPVTFLDSAGLRLLDRFARECGQRGIPFAAVAPSGGGPRRVLEIVGFGPPLVVGDLPTAIASASRRTS